MVVCRSTHDTNARKEGEKNTQQTNYNTCRYDPSRLSLLSSREGPTLMCRIGCDEYYCLQRRKEFQYLKERRKKIL
jgi:hypothetical protein